MPFKPTFTYTLAGCLKHELYFFMFGIVATIKCNKSTLLGVADALFPFGSTRFSIMHLSLFDLAVSSTYRQMIEWSLDTSPISITSSHFKRSIPD